MISHTKIKTHGNASTPHHEYCISTQKKKMQISYVHSSMLSSLIGMIFVLHTPTTFSILHTKFKQIYCNAKYKASKFGIFFFKEA